MYSSCVLKKHVGHKIHYSLHAVDYKGIPLENPLEILCIIINIITVHDN